MVYDGILNTANMVMDLRELSLLYFTQNNPKKVKEISIISKLPQTKTNIYTELALFAILTHILFLGSVGQLNRSVFLHGADAAVK